MPSAFTTRNRLVKQAPGEGTNTWGDILNSGVFDLIDFAADGITTISASGATTLTVANGATDQARARILKVTAAGSWAITLPSVEKWYLVRAVTASGTITCGGEAATVVAGDTAIVICDGVDCRKAQSTDFAGARLKNLADGVDDQDAVTYAQLIAAAFATQAGDYPGLPGKKRQHLTVLDDESSVLWAWANLIPFERKTLDFTASPLMRYEVDTAGGPVDATLPPDPEDGDWVIFADAGTTDSFAGFARFNLNLLANGSTIHGAADDRYLDGRGDVVLVRFSNSTWMMSRGTA